MRLRIRRRPWKLPPAPIAGAALTDLGVHPGPTDYLPLASDPAIARALTYDGRRVTVVHGARLAGSSRALAESARRLLPGHVLLVPVPDPALTLGQLIAAAAPWLRHGGEAVLWLDALTPVQLEQFDAHLFRTLPDGLRVCVTAETGTITGAHVPAQVVSALSRYAEVVAVGATRRGRAGLTEWDQVTRAPTEESLERRTLLRVVTGWARIGMPGRLDRTLLRRLYDQELATAREGAERRPHTPEAGDQGRTGPDRAAKQKYDPDRGLVVRRDPPVRRPRPEPTPEHSGPEPVVARWAGGRAAGASRANGPGFARALAWAKETRPRLVEEVPGGHLRPHPLLALAAGEGIGDAVWRYACRTLDAPSRLRVALSAYDRGEVAESRHWCEHLADTGDPALAPVMLLLGSLALDEDDAEEARRWWRRTVDTDHPQSAPPAMQALGHLDHQSHEWDLARYWYHRALGTGHSDVAMAALLGLAHVEEDAGDLTAARHWRLQLRRLSEPRE